MLQFLKLSLVFTCPLGITLSVERNMNMAKKVYHLTISYDEASDTIEYLCETLEDDISDCTTDCMEGGLEFEADVPGFKVLRIDIGKYFDEPTLKLIRECNEVAEA